ncbi:MAG: hypothetical protein LBQ79_06460 [Deltaproteobacteria bacterium]|jgi:hypothetical protein|nr:hypothetical protein [Deltaproteobacteria bacterium]
MKTFHGGKIFVPENLVPHQIHTTSPSIFSNQIHGMTYITPHPAVGIPPQQAFGQGESETSSRSDKKI